MNAKRALAGFLAAAMTVGMVQPVMADEGEALQPDITTQEQDVTEEAVEAEMASETIMETEMAAEEIVTAEAPVETEYIYEEDLVDAAMEEAVEEEYDLIDLEPAGEEAPQEQAFALYLQKCENGEIRFAETGDLPEADPVTGDWFTECRSFAKDREVRFEVIPAEGYQVVSVEARSLTDEAVTYPLASQEEGWQLLVPEDDVLIAAVFAPEEYTVTEEESREAKETVVDEAVAEEIDAAEEAEVEEAAEAGEEEELLGAGDVFVDINSGLKYTIITGGVSIEGHSGNPTSLNIPSSIRGYSVIAIADKAFCDCTSLRSVTLPETLQTIGARAFWNTSISSITIPKNVNSCKTYYYASYGGTVGPFGANTSLRNVTFASGMSKIPDNILRNATSVQTVNIPSSVTEIGKYAFSGTGITNLNMMASCKMVNTIGEGAFMNCSSLRSIELSAALQTIDTSAFEECRVLGSIVFPETLQTIGAKAFWKTALTSVSIPRKVSTCITSYYASYGGTVGPFGANTSLRNVTFASGMSKIPDNILRNATSVQTVNIPSSVTEIGKYAFSGTGITNLNMMASCKMVNTIGEGAFMNCSSLRSIELSAALQTIGTSAFEECRALGSIVFPETLQTIGAKAFWKTALTSVSIPRKVSTCITSYYASYGGTVGPFGANTNLTSVTFEEGMKKIPDSVLRNASSVQTVNIPSSVTEVGKYAFSGTNLKILDMKTSCNQVRILGEGAFMNCRSLRNVVLPDALQTIGVSAFEDCSFLENIVLPDALQTIDAKAFWKTSLYSVYIPRKVSTCKTSYYASYGGTIGPFGANTTLETVTFASGMETIPANILRNASSVKTVSIPNSVTNVAQYAFDQCDNLEKGEYEGTRADLYRIAIDKNNDPLVNLINADKVKCLNRPVHVTSVKLNKTSQTLAVGKKMTLAATVSPANATNKKVTWSSSNTAVATVNSSGVVTAKKAGTATITAKTADGGKKATCKVTVKTKVPVTGVKLNKTSLTIGNGQSAALTATVSPSNAANKKVTWKSSNTNLATVTSAGKVTAKANANGTVKITATTEDGKKVASCTVTVKKPSVSYRTHVQTYGWQKYVKDGAMAGTQGESKRLEGINIKLSNLPYSGDIVYRTHVQTYGWQSWKKNNQMSGTSGESKRLEGIQIYLTGEMAKHYDVYYRVHAQTYGWLGWAKNGEMAGTSGLSKRLEGINIRLVPKGGKAPGSTAKPNVVGSGGKLPDNPYKG